MNKSFTLIEILVVIVVVGVLSAFILVDMGSIAASANIAKSQAFINSMNNSLLLARVSQWKLDEAVGSTTANDSWGTNTGTLSGTAPLAQFQTSGCVSNNCLLFDGNDYVTCGSGTSLDITVGSWGSWVYPVAWNTAQSSNYIIDQYQVWGLIVKTTGSDAGRVESFGIAGAITGDIVTTDKISLNTWSYLISAYDGETLRVYINGIEKGTDTDPTGNLNSGGPFYVGQYPSAGYQFNGRIDDVRVYNQALSPSEINQNYYIGVNKLFRNSGIGLNEFNKRLVELKSNLAKQ